MNLLMISNEYHLLDTVEHCRERMWLQYLASFFHQKHYRACGLDKIPDVVSVRDSLEFLPAYLYMAAPVVVQPITRRAWRIERSPRRNLASTWTTHSL